MDNNVPLAVKTFNDRVRAMNSANGKVLTLNAQEARNLHAEIYELLATIAELSKEEPNANINIIDHLVDSDINKQGRYTPISELLIEDPSVLNTVDVLVITAVAYQETIVKKLDKFTGSIYLLGPNGLNKVQR